MMPYEVLYGRPCRSPVCWMEVGERPSTGPNLIRHLREGGLDTEAEAAFHDESEAGRNQSTQRMKGHSSSTRGTNGIGVEICHPYVVEARRDMLFEHTYGMP